jgi:hypothetical protein
MQKVPNKRAFDYDVESLLEYPPKEKTPYYVVSASGMSEVNGNYYPTEVHNGFMAYKNESSVYCLLKAPMEQGRDNPYWLIWDNYQADSVNYCYVASVPSGSFIGTPPLTADGASWSTNSQYGVAPPPIVSVELQSL